MGSTSIHADIVRGLQELEQAEKARILFAVESGSRAWGFPSKDSDYDVRFIYVRPRDWYLAVDLEAKRDVIERPITSDLDVAGWDLRKALKLFAKSNPPLLEWLDSSIVYLDRHGFAEKLRGLRNAFFSPISCAYHYLHMAEGNCRAFLRGPTVWTKKYFYVLRPLLAVRWLEQERGVVPMAFGRLLEAIADQPSVVAAIERLLERKVAGEELDEGPALPVLQEFIDAEMARFAAMPVEAGRPPVDFERLNALFREMLGGP